MRKMMKKFIGVLAVVVAVLIMNVDAYAASVTLTGPGTVRAGDTIKLNITIAEAGRNAIEGSFSYDSNQVSLSSVTTALSGWKVETNGNTIMAYDENMTNPTKANTVVATATFNVKSTVAAGTTLKISLNNTAVAASSQSYDIGTVSYSVVIAKPLSNVNTLSNITIAGYNLTPAFNSSTTTYNIGEVEFEVSALTVNATPTESTARVNVSGNSLSVGNNTITITVTAENGSVNNYQINVVRKQDPNYVASSNANVSQMNISSGKLSPDFKPDVMEYVVYVPFEELGKGFQLTGSPADGKAVGVSNGTIEALNEGVNEVKLICTAEDGTTKEYVVKVVVMPEFNGEIPAIGDLDTLEPTVEPETEPSTEEVTKEPDKEEDETTKASEDVTEPSVDEEENGGKKGVPIWLLIVLVIAGIGLGFGGCYILLNNKKTA